MMRWLIFPFFLLSLCIPSLLKAQTDQFGLPDTLRVSSVLGPLGGKTTVDVYLYNDEALYGISVPLRFSNQYLHCDTIILAGSKLEPINLKPFIINNDSGYLLIGGLVVEEEPISTGLGLLARLVFSVSRSAPVGLEITIDSGFIPPAGEMVLTGPAATDIIPVFQAGVFTISKENLPPIFKPIPKQYISEGEKLTFSIEAYDKERDAFIVSASRLPEGAIFHSETNAFEWTPPFTGPFSSLGNPFEVVFTASDGNSSAHITVPIEVINKNRSPQLMVVDSADGEAGDLVQILLSAQDPDFEEVTINVNGLPEGCVYDHQNPGLIQWQTDFNDSGHYNIAIEAIDPLGVSVTKSVGLRIHAIQACDLKIDGGQAYLGETATVPISLTNRVKIKSMHLLIRYDPTALTLTSVSRTGTRTQGWERLTITRDDYSGLVWINGYSDLPGGEIVPPLAEGEGSIALMTFRTSSNPDFAAMLVPIKFEFPGSPEDQDNTFTDSADQLIGSDQIAYTDGSFFIKKYEGRIGDINLNNVAFEISDVVYFTNYFIDPQRYPLNGERWLNSDVNQDGRPGTVGDLIYLINIMIGNVSEPGKSIAIAGEFSSLLKMQLEPEKLLVFCDWDQMLGGVFLRFACGETAPRINLTERTSSMKLFSNFDEGALSIIICDPEGQRIKAGQGPLLEIISPEIDLISLESGEMSDIYGTPIAVKISAGANTPKAFELGQNYPNPFNPSTTIGFGLPTEGHVSLKIFNIQGQVVRTLIDQNMKAGYHEMFWDGIDKAGQKVSSGIYLYRLECGDYSESRKMIMLK